MTRTLYDLCGKDDQRFSPYCWRAKLALAHKELDYITEPVRFTEKEKIAFSGQKLVPVLKDGSTVVHDSWTIAEYLEDTYPDAPSLFPGTDGRNLARQTNEWMDGLHRSILTCIVLDVYNRLDADDQAYFRPSREERFGMTLEEVQADRETIVAEFREISLATLRGHMHDRLFINGDAPAYGDYAVFGTFQWARLTSSFDLLTPDDPLYAWRERMIARLPGGA